MQIDYYVNLREVGFPLKLMQARRIGMGTLVAEDPFLLRKEVG